MEISNNDLARILGNIEANVAAQMNSSVRQEAAIARLDEKMSKRLDDHEKRLRDLEKGAAKSGAIAGVGASLGVAVIIEIIKRKLG